MHCLRRFGIPLVLSVTATACAVEESEPTDDLEVVAEAEQEAQICFDNGVVHGIDVSYYQGTIDWSAVATEYDFAFTRINHGDFMDPEFENNWNGIKAAGMLRGAYQYFDPGGDVAWQAQVVVDKLGMLAPGDLPPVIDVESTDGLGGAAIVEAVAQWMEIVEAGTGKTPIIYTGKYFWQDNVGSAAFADYPLWHAQYPNACQPPNNPPPSCGCSNIADQWSDVLIWQYSSSGSVPGISGNVDLDVFNGTYEDLVAFANAGGAGYGASLASVEAPDTVLAGESFTVRLTYTNTGASAWDANTKVGTTEPRDRMSAFYDASWAGETRPAVVEGSVENGQSYTFEFSMKAPAMQGNYTESFGLVQEAVTWFADQSGPPDNAVTLTIQVVNGPVNGGGDDGGGSATGGAGEGGDTGEGGADEDGSGSDEDCSCKAAGATNDSGNAPLSALIVAGVIAATARRRLRRD